ncbi:hypothetical protein FEM48_Zijuj02G0184400 [Ziziphus jujuba var. spinosa]|uniref:Uncharacterized protein n=1 Tax=Ziziphus jujuba var. spinosa TaxID=714518 RepID=A0A978VX96_ZIZJJ|nr:hypothetical protein FEM48_Zijuj02G0184400 [Ziziphus jujuba var. spinosa]
MVKRFKIWAYKEGDLPMAHNGPTTYIYSIEGQFIFEMETRPSPFMAQHPDEAHAFFIPLSVSKITDYQFRPHHETFFHRLVRIFKDYIFVIADKYPYWNRSSGADHFMVSCHDWASRIERKNHKLYENFMKVLCNANTSEGFKPTRDVSIPEYNLKAFNLGPPRLGQPPDKRPILAFFAGAAHGDIRDILFKYWKDKDGEVQVYENLDKKKNYHGLMGQTKFCLCPSGSEVASPRVVEAMYAGCVPVLISDYYAVPFDDVLDWNKFSVQIPPKRIPEIKTILKGIPHKKYLKLQKRVMQVSRHFELNRPAKPFDVFHMVLHSQLQHHFLLITVPVLLLYFFILTTKAEFTKRSIYIIHMDKSQMPLAFSGHHNCGTWPENRGFKDMGLSANIPTKWNESCEEAREDFNPCAIPIKDSARDTLGHGTLVSSIAVGNYVKQASYFGYATETSKGTAPSARFAVYKVALNKGMDSSNMLACIDQAISDGVDLISVSLHDKLGNCHCIKIL